MPMLKEFKEWLEGLFRPVINVQENGKQYVARTPTIHDLNSHKLYIVRETETLTVGQATAASTAWITATIGAITEISMATGYLQAGTSNCYVWMEVESQGRGVLNHKTPQISNYLEILALYNMQPLYLAQGDRFRFWYRHDSGLGVAKTCYFRYRIREVYI